MISITSSSGPMRWTAWRSQYEAFGDLTAAPAADARPRLNAERDH
jgi:hypothetical protein